MCSPCQGVREPEIEQDLHDRPLALAVAGDGIGTPWLLRQKKVDAQRNMRLFLFLMFAILAGCESGPIGGGSYGYGGDGYGGFGYGGATYGLQMKQRGNRRP